MNDDELLQGLRAAARRSGSAPTRTDLDAPLGAAFEERVTAEILAARRAAPAPDAKARARAPAAPGLGRHRLLASVTGLVAAAAVVLLVLHGRRGDEVAALPAYTLSASGGLDTTRGIEPGEAQTTLSASPGAPISIVLRPAVDVGAPVSVRVFAVRGASASEKHPAVRVAASGAVEVQGSAAALVGAVPGDAMLLILLGIAGRDFDAAAIARGEPAPRGVVLEKIAVHVLP